jgi:hypothetical protein
MIVNTHLPTNVLVCLSAETFNESKDPPNTRDRYDKNCL